MRQSIRQTTAFSIILLFAYKDVATFGKIPFSILQGEKFIRQEMEGRP
jgi:hypothetical protein